MLRTLRTTPSFRMTNIMHHGPGSVPSRLGKCTIASAVAGLSGISMTILTAPAHDMRACTGRVLSLNVGAISDFSVRKNVISLHHSLSTMTGTRGAITIVSTK